jgi:hypothetical protein
MAARDYGRTHIVHAAIFGERTERPRECARPSLAGCLKTRSPIEAVSQALMSTAWESEEVDGVVAVGGDVAELPPDPDAFVVVGVL